VSIEGDSCTRNFKQKFIDVRQWCDNVSHPNAFLATYNCRQLS